MGIGCGGNHALHTSRACHPSSKYLRLLVPKARLLPGAPWTRAAKTSVPPSRPRCPRRQHGWQTILRRDCPVRNCNSGVRQNSKMRRRREVSDPIQRGLRKIVVIAERLAVRRQQVRRQPAGRPHRAAPRAGQELVLAERRRRVCQVRGRVAPPEQRERPGLAQVQPAPPAREDAFDLATGAVAGVRPLRETA